MGAGNMKWYEIKAMPKATTSISAPWPTTSCKRSKSHHNCRLPPNCNQMRARVWLRIDPSGRQTCGRAGQAPHHPHRATAKLTFVKAGWHLGWKSSPCLKAKLDSFKHQGENALVRRTRDDRWWPVMTGGPSFPIQSPRVTQSCGKWTGRPWEKHLLESPPSLSCACQVKRQSGPKAPAMMGLTILPLLVDYDQKIMIIIQFYPKKCGEKKSFPILCNFYVFFLGPSISI